MVRKEKCIYLVNSFKHFFYAFGNSRNLVAPLHEGFGNSRKLVAPLHGGFGNSRKLVAPLHEGFGNSRKLVAPLHEGFGKARRLIRGKSGVVQQRSTFLPFHSSSLRSFSRIQCQRPLYEAISIPHALCPMLSAPCPLFHSRSFKS